MESTKSEAKCTGKGQAITLNNLTCLQLKDLFAPMLGPDGLSKCLVDRGNNLCLTRDGLSMCRNVPFSHPTSNIIISAAKNLYDITGDGLITFILQTTSIFNESYSYYVDGAPIQTIISGLYAALNETTVYLKRNKIALDDNLIKELIHSNLSTKFRNPELLVEIMYSAIIACDVEGKMIELMKLDGGDFSESKFIKGLMLDHAGRHYNMPKNLSNCCVLVTNISMEFEKPEMAGTFKYSSIQERIAMSQTENVFILRRAKKIAEIARELKKQGKSLLVVSERGIDMKSLAVLADAGVLALRRSKRANTERLIKMCGGVFVTSFDQISMESLGKCGKVSVVEFDENMYTIIEEAPNPCSCTILIRGSSDIKTLESALKSCLGSIKPAMREKVCIRGGKYLYKGLIEHLSYLSRNSNEYDFIGYKILASVFEYILKVLIRNSNGDVHKDLSILMKRGTSELVYDNLPVVIAVIKNAVYTSTSLLAADEIIVAGKSIKVDPKDLIK